MVALAPRSRPLPRCSAVVGLGRPGRRAMQPVFPETHRTPDCAVDLIAIVRGASTRLCSSMLILPLYHCAYGLVFLKAAAEGQTDNQLFIFPHFIPWWCGSWQLGPYALGDRLSKSGLFLTNHFYCRFGILSSSCTFHSLEVLS